MQTQKFTIEKLQVQSFVNQLKKQQNHDFRGGYVSDDDPCNSVGDEGACSMDDTCVQINTVNVGQCHTFTNAGCTTSEPGCY